MFPGMGMHPGMMSGMGMGMGMPGMPFGMQQPGMQQPGMQMPFQMPMQMPYGQMPGAQGMPMMNGMGFGMPNQFQMQDMQGMQMPTSSMSLHQMQNGLQPQGMQQMQQATTGEALGPAGLRSQLAARGLSKALSTVSVTSAAPESLRPASEGEKASKAPRPEEEDKELLPLPPPLADGTRQVLVTIPRPASATSDGLEADGSVKIPEFNVTINLPEWYKEAQTELVKGGPAWLPQVTINVSDLPEATEQLTSPSGPSVSFLGRRASKASAASKASGDKDGEGDDASPGGAGKLQAAMQARRRAMQDAEEVDEKVKRSKFFPYIVAILFTNFVYKSGLKTMRDWASKMQTHFEDTCQMQMRNCISWLSRALRTFARTLTMDSHAGLDLAPSRSGTIKLLDLGSDLTARQRLAIRAYVLFDVLLTGIEAPPQPLTRFLSRLAQPEGIMLYIPKTYFTESEQEELNYDERGGIHSQPQSRQHQQLVAGFLIPRALLGGLFASWVRTMDSDASVGAERGKRNIQTLGALIYLGCQKKYELIGSVHDIPGLSSATSDRLTQFGLDKRLVAEVAELIEKLVVFFTQPDAQVSMVERVQSNPFVAGNIKVAPRDHHGEGAEPAVVADEAADTPVSPRKSIVDKIRSMTPALSEAANTVQQRAGRLRQSVVAPRIKMDQVVPTADAEPP